MKVLIQRVAQASVQVDGKTVGEVGQGLLLLIGIESHDDNALVARMAQRIVGYRLFADDAGKMNLDVRDVGGSLLAVSQFTLAADTKKGRRPSFSRAAAPEKGRELYQYCVERLRAEGVTVATGVFAADMQVALVNDGPVTFLLEL
ncbi:D-aminoacyl-tRNA deacylase [Alcanivorax sp. DP30]|uniref:D-aminoacyl-tRNA deacylase n=1 Tax=Alcanivorax sp. DP30 TaxID=2606217 RepID=UPI00136A484E|nr:D-aminoacyl-tRNA deacylase [Alcanivorax sp. DP30]MZR62587.1 D-tyrosyl-tRNA(Tyr) deacylase [Alcanivorax sp. DP30]